MGLGPILPGRIPGSLIASRLRDNLSITQRALATLQQQVATGQRFFLPGEDPAAASRTIVLQRALEQNDQLKINLNVDKSLLQTTDSSLQNVGQAIARGKSILLSGIGSATGATEKQALAAEVESMIQGLANDANSRFQGRYLFGGSESQQQPFEILSVGVVRYNGDRFDVNSYISSEFVAPNNIDGATAFGAFSDPVGTDVDPALTLETKLADLHAGRGISAGVIQVTVDTGVPVTQSIDLSNAQTINDVKNLVENAFTPGTVTVDIVPGPPKNGLRITPSSGTIAIADQQGAHTAADLGIVSAAAASITGGDIDPRLTLGTPLSAFNGGSGASLSGGLFISNGSIQKAVDVSAAVTVEDLFNTLKAANADLDLGINDAGDGLAISTRLSGVDFSIGENGGTTATSLGIRTFGGSTLLGSLNLGQGVPVNEVDQQGNLLPALLEIRRRDGSTVNVDLKGIATVQDVLDKINAVDPGVLVASLNSVGNGVSITDGSGAGPLTIVDSEISKTLGINGTEPGANPAVPLVGREVNPRQANGIFSLLLQLRTALSAGDDGELTRLGPLFDKESDRVNLVRGELGSRENLLDQVRSRLDDETLHLRETLSTEFDVDMTEAVTQLAQLTATLEATLKVASQSLQVSLLSYL